MAAARTRGSPKIVTTVAGYVLPGALDAVARSPRWTAYVEGDRLGPNVVEAAFGERPDSTWRFYTIDEMEAMTEAWRQEKDPGWFGETPDDIRPESSVLIGELGYDRPFALDYRSCVPVVRLMNLAARWPVVASSSSELLARLGT
jgi:hypothetical protein